MPETDRFIITVICTLLGTAVSFVFSYAAFRRISKKDSSESGENRGVIMSDIGYIKAGVDDLKRESRETSARVGLLTERVTRCEESCKQAHHRIDELRGNNDVSG